MKKNNLSLQEQLLKSGLAKPAKAREVNAEKRKQEKMLRNNGVAVVDEIKQSAEQARQQQIERDRALNLERKRVEEHKALLAQIKQLVELNRIAQDENGQSYQFDDAGKVKVVYVSGPVREALAEGRAAIVRVGAQYEVVPAEIARRIQQRDEASVLVLNESGSEVMLADDPYAAYQIPDDLMW